MKKLLPLSCGNQASSVHLIRKNIYIYIYKSPKLKENSHNQRTCTGSHEYVWDFRILCRCQPEDWDKRDQCLVIMVT